MTAVWIYRSIRTSSYNQEGRRRSRRGGIYTSGVAHRIGQEQAYVVTLEFVDSQRDV